MQKIQEIINNQLCSGCGVCISEDRSGTATMMLNADGFLTPKLSVMSTQIEMATVCPFSAGEPDADALGSTLFDQSNQQDEYLGYYQRLYAGYAPFYRDTSSSGGVATFVINQLFEDGVIDHAFVIKTFDHGYAYQLISSNEDIVNTSKTRYTPVTLENLFSQINKIDGKIAVTGVACFIKAIRLKQLKEPTLKNKIPFLIGIICGGLKSKYYTDFLAQSAGCNNHYRSAEYRVKNPNSFALDYQFTCVEIKSDQKHSVKMMSLGDMWGTGLFKSNACDFCDDVSTELADISLGDAWITPYAESGAGNNIIITRSLLADKIIQNAIINNELILDVLCKEKIIESQQGSFNHRYKGLFYRLKTSKIPQTQLPSVRSRILKKQNVTFNIVQHIRKITRAKSLQLWKKYRDTPRFNHYMRFYLLALRIATKVHHKYLHLKKTF